MHLGRLFCAKPSHCLLWSSWYAGIRYNMLGGQRGQGEMPQAPPPRSCVASSVLISLSGLQLLHLTGAVLAPASQVCWENSVKSCPQKLDARTPSKYQNVLAVVVTWPGSIISSELLPLLFSMAVQSALQEDFVPSNSRPITF